MFREYLINFMEKKAEHINKHLTPYVNGTFIAQYFLPSDREIMSHWGEEQCRSIWYEIEGDIFHNKQIVGLQGLTCPFCLYHQKDCAKCEYGFRHKQCADIDSDYKKIRQSLHEILTGGISITNDDYRAMCRDVAIDVSKTRDIELKMLGDDMVKSMGIPKKFLDFSESKEDKKLCKACGEETLNNDWYHEVMFYQKGYDTVGHETGRTAGGNNNLCIICMYKIKQFIHTKIFRSEDVHQDLIDECIKEREMKKHKCSVCGKSTVIGNRGKENWWHLQFIYQKEFDSVGGERNAGYTNLCQECRKEVSDLLHSKYQKARKK